MPYTLYPRGSEWRKWDLHIHTPETKKNDQFVGSNPAEKWNNYADSINKSPENIPVIGITDYLSTDNYFKFKSLVADGTITKKFDMILPNVELRVLPVTASSTPINLHCIFNPALDDQLESRFFSKIHFQNDRSYSAQLNELRSLGRSFPNNSQLDDNAALKFGISQFVIEVSQLRTVFKNDPELRDNTIIVVSNNSKDGASGVNQHSDYFEDAGSQLDGTRWSIYKLSDAIFSSNDKDILYFTGQGVDEKDIVVEKCGTLMPCFHGCDAHENSKIFNPVNNKFCWIKADPTFEGLKQTLYEPQDRVKIQAFQPDIKNDRFVISEFKFIDSGKTFGNQSILLNENLNAIIGGKSSGKSLLMYAAAKSIDPDQVEKTSQRLGFEGYKLSSTIDFKVTWKNGEVDTLRDTVLNNKNHKIIYIPQLYINHLVEKNNKDDLNILIENILVQDSEFKKFYEDLLFQIDKTSNEIESLLNTYLQTRQKIIDNQQKSKEVGRSESIITGIQSLKVAIAAGQKSSNLNQQEFDAYSLLNTQKAAADAAFKQLEIKEQALDQIQDEIKSIKLDLLGNDGLIDGIPLRGKIDIILDQFSDVPSDVAKVVQKLIDDFNKLSANLASEVTTINIDDQKQKQKAIIDGINVDLKQYLDKIVGQQELQKLVKQLDSEQTRFDNAIALEKNYTSYFSDYTNLRNKMVQLLNYRHASYEQIKQKINGTRKDIGNGITLESALLYKQDDFSLYNQVNRAAVSGDNIFNTLLLGDNLVNYENVLKLFANQLRVTDGKLVYDNDSKNSLPLKNNSSLEEVLRGLIANKFTLDYTVSYKGDDLLSMSPGKKGTVLLILFLEINSSQYPIFIDQPEDNLDNRTIYDLLCKMIKVKKKDRQILIVSHNANLVIATDSENIIVANQEGQETSKPTSIHQFEYINGSLEHAFEKNDKIKEILHQQGIKQHSCDILEGGGEAFKQRERKYSIK